MNKFDKEILKKLDGYSSPVSNDMWDRIANNLPEQDNSSSRNWWLPAFGMLVLISGVLALVFNISYDQKEGSILVDNVKSELMNTRSIDGVAYLNEQTNKIKPSSSGLIETKSKKTNNEDIISKQNENKTKSPIKSTKPNKTKNSKSIEKNNINKSSLSEGGKLPTLKIETGQATANLYQQYNTIFKKSRSHSNDEGAIVERLEEESFERLPLEINLLKDQSELKSISARLNGKRAICPTFSNLRFGIFAEAFYSNDFGMRALSYNSPVTEADYLNARNRTETAQYSFSAGARVSFLLPSGIGAKTGISYTQINETFKYEDPNHKQTKTVIIKEYKWENNVIVDSTEVTKTIDVPGRLNVVSQNRYRVIDLPLLFTYEWGYKKRFYYAVTGGPMFNIRFTQKGKFLNPETLTPVDFSSDSGNYKAFNTNIGTSVFLSFAVNYQLGNGVDVFVEPNMRHFLKNTTLNTYLLNQRYTVLGLGFGIKYKL